MKKNTLTLLFILLLGSANLFGQSGLNGINYQAIARNTNGSVLANQSIKVRTSVLSGSAAGAVEYQEEHNLITNQLGLFILQIGQGKALSGTFSAIPWKNANQFLKVELAIGSTPYSDLGSSQFMSVPYALYALNPGPAGPQGLQGIPGVKGDKGEIGLTGPTGLTGAAGLTGPAGSTGPIGLQGIQGIPGVKGDKGDKGEVGLTGPIGPAGSTGPIGPQGIQGIPGVKGDKGDKGEVGLTGSIGLAGPAGLTGPAGSTGPIGPQGIQGIPGVKGDKGDKGEVGLTGPIGLSGPTGLIGPIGPQGIQGISGVKGDKGDTGDKGDQGDVGPIGPIGAEGPQGIPGTITTAAAGDLSGTFPAPVVVKLQNQPIAATVPVLNDVLKFNGTSWSPSPATAGGSLTLPFSASENNSSTQFSISNQDSGVSIEGENSSTIANASAVRGIISSTSPGGFSTGIRGVNKGTGGLGIGVWGSQEGSGWGVYGNTPAGIGVHGNSSGSGTGVYANSSSGTGLLARSNTGVAVEISITNTTNLNPALKASTISNGNAIEVSTTGSGKGIVSNTVNGFAVHGITTSITSAGILGDNFSGGEAVVGRNKSDIAGAVVGRNDGGGYGVRGFVGTNTSGTAVGVLGQIGINGSTGIAGKFVNSNLINTNATVEVLTNGTGTALHLDHTGTSGNIAVFQSNTTNVARIDKSGKGYFNNGTVSSGADIAESFAVVGNSNTYEPGDILVISIDQDRVVEKSTKPYSSLVAGVYATKPGVLLTEHSIDTNLEGEVPMGVIGVIPTKVCLEGGAISRGDLLVSSSIVGVAMKADPDKVKVGQVLGKALENYNANGVNKIKVLVSIK